MNWKWKALAQKGLSWLPYARKWQPWMQRHLFRTLKITDFFLEDRLQHVDRHWRAWEKHGPKRSLTATLELGTGWYPVVPLGMFLCGVKEIHTADQFPLLRLSAVRELNQWLQAWHEQGKLKTLLPPLLPSRWQQLQAVLQKETDSLAEVLKALGIQYHQGDARQLPLPSAKIDLVHSNNTFEHIPAPVLWGLLREMKRVVAPTGMMSHYIDLADHYSYSDARLSPFHFLKYSERQWRWIENRLQSQNRMRVGQYQEMYQQLTLPITEILAERAAIPPGLALASPYSQMPREEVSVVYAQFISAFS